MSMLLNVNGTNCWIYHDETGERRAGLDACFVIDPGARADMIIQKMERKKLYPAVILLTHGHFDHVGALPDVSAYYEARGLKPEVAIHTADARYLGADSREAHRECWRAAAGNTRYIDRFWKTMPEPARLLEEGSRVGRLMVLHLPGHTPGSVGFFDEQEKELYSGDCLFAVGRGRTDLPGGDEELLRESLQRIRGLGAGVRVYPGHEESFTL
jgi:glyoxylase-like metal-dependent hydrolase (beta-lactamase superfamily II)